MAQASQAPSMKGKVCLVTGGTSGIGKVTALELAKKGAIVIIGGLKGAGGEKALAEIRAGSDNSNVEFMPADLSSQKALRRFAAEFSKRYNRLDVLINNAGATVATRQESEDGIEYTLALNLLAPFLLTHLLLPLLKKSAPSRIINVSSSGHKYVSGMHFDDLQMKKKYAPIRAYNHSKLGLVLFTYALAEKLQGTGVTVNVLHPGIIPTTGMGEESPAIFKSPLVLRLLSRVLLSPEQGAATTIYLASSLEVEAASGKYFVKSREARSSKASYNMDAAHQLWEMCAHLTHVTA